jgi:hypothetical protein
VSPHLVEQLPLLPSVLQHANLGAWNVIARAPDEFAVVDWESAREHSFPLWDIVFFLTDALLHLDGATSPKQRDLHTARLFLGKLPSSATLFRWVRDCVRSLELPPECVGSLTTLCWLDHAVADGARAASAKALGGAGPPGASYSERTARLWLREAGLGPAWNAWV